MGKGRKDAVKYDEDENEGRGNWSGRLDFILSAVGFAVGLGNVWRFPYRAYENGGATFLVPYVVMLVLAGLPLFFMEMAFGQFSSLGPISVWNAMPLFRGVGYAMVVISALVCIYYNMIIAYTLYYFFVSIRAAVPWQTCEQSWIDNYRCQDRDVLNATQRNITVFLCESMKKDNLTGTAEYIDTCTRKTPSEVYWERVVLDVSGSIEEGSGDIKWHLALCLLLAWVIIFFCLIKGIKSSGKVVYVTATFPYIVLIILLIRNVTLEGAWEGIKFYIIPKWSQLYNVKAWHAAAIQIFYSLGVAFGGLETMASYNRFRNNIYRDVLIVATLNCATSIFAGFVIFSVLGFMSVRTGVPIDKVVDSGPGLAFIAYPEGIAMMPAPPIWSILFFLMLFTLGLDSQFAMMETVISAVVDEITWLRRPRRKVIFTLLLCIVLFFAGLPQCSRAGIYILTLFDWYSAGFSLFVVSLLELIAIAWIYNYKRFSSDIEMMIGFKPNVYWTIMWLFLTPITIVLMIGYSVISYSPATYAGKAYPNWAINVGWGMVGLALIFVPLLAIFEYCKESNFVQTMKRVLSPNKEWGPAVDKYRTGLYAPQASGVLAETEPGFNGGYANDNMAYAQEKL